MQYVPQHVLVEITCVPVYPSSRHHYSPSFVLSQIGKKCIAKLYTITIPSVLLQTPQYVIEYDSRSFQPDCHVRFHGSNAESNHVWTYLWPALREGKGGPCVHKAVVIT